MRNWTGGHPRGALLRRAVWSFGGQFTSSASNFLLTILVLSVASQADFSSFSVCLTTYMLVVQLVRASVGYPLMVLHSADDVANPKAQGAPAGLSMVIGVGGSVVMVGISVLVRHGRDQFLILAAVLPFLCLQDLARHVAFARARPAFAALSDGVWLALQLAGSAALSLRGTTTAFALLAVWCLSGVVAAAVGVVRLRMAPSVGHIAGWVRTNAAFCKRFVLEFLATAGSVYIVMYGLAIIAGTAQLGRLKAAQAFLGPVSVLIMGGTALGIPEGVRAGQNPTRLWKLMILLSSFLIVVSCACGAAVYALLPTIGPRFFPGTWAAARPLIPLVVAFSAGLGASTGALSGLRGLREMAWIVRARCVVGATSVVIGLSAAAFTGASGALVGLAIGEWIVAVAGWSRLRALTAGCRSRIDRPIPSATSSRAST